MHSIKKYLKALKYVIAAVSLFAGAGLVLIIVISAIHFPYDVDAPLTREEVEAAQKYYTEAYRKPVSENQEIKRGPNTRRNIFVLRRLLPTTSVSRSR
jgi:hypothetical protein